MGDLREGKDMTPKLIGDTYMKYATKNSRQRNRFGIYECQYCNKEFECQATLIKTNRVISCGCFSLTKPEGLSLSRFYTTWHNMIKRCTNPKNPKYKDYGGRGITVCDVWLDVRNFVAWAEVTHPNIGNVSLDRIDNDKGYFPENCRWTDATTQIMNQRIKKNNTSGFVGIYWNNKNSNWRTFIYFNNVRFNIGSFPTIEDAVLARDNYIIENKLPHKLSTDYRGTNE